MFLAQNIFTKNIQRNFDIVTIVCADNFMVVTKKKISVYNNSKKVKRRWTSMATNPPYGDNRRNGAVKGRSQTYNPKTDKWVKRDAETGQFMDVKQDGTPFKGVRKEK